MFTVATWNVNSVKARLGHLLDWLKSFQPDALLLQEIKCVDQEFPRFEIEAAGYHCAVHGQKTYNGVAILSRQKPLALRPGLPGDPQDSQARYIEADFAGNLTLAAIYLPNGNPVESEKFPYKLAWMDRLTARARALLAEERLLVLGGDYNVIPEPQDCWDAKAWEGDALYRPESRSRLRTLCHLGLTDALRALHPEPGLYSFWDYQAGRWPRDEGIRIDHLLLSPQAADRLLESGIDKKPRAKEKASDHTPVWCRLEIAAP